MPERCCICTEREHLDWRCANEWPHEPTELDAVVLKEEQQQEDAPVDAR